MFFIQLSRSDRSVFKKMRGIALCAMAAWLCLFGFSRSADAATNVYYSVGQNTSDHKTGSPTVTISGGTATFSVAQTATNMGVGDKVTYNTSDIAYISAKISTTQWSLITATGTAPADIVGATVDSIAHAFSSLNAAVGNGVSGNATSSSKLNTADLVAGDYILNIPLYYDSGADSTSVSIAGFTAGASNYIRLYTPTNTSTEVNQTQRHAGRWDTSKYRLDGSFNFTHAMSVSVPYTRIDGLQIRNSTAGGTAYGLRYSSSGADDDVRISNNVLRTSQNRWSSLNVSVASSAGKLRVWNNVITDANGGAVISTAAGVTSYVYNNTFYNTITGISIPTFGSQVMIFKNNLMASTTNPFTTSGKAGAGSDYNSTTNASLGYIVSGSGNTHDRLNQSFSFVDSSQDYHLIVGASGALDVGADLSADADLPFATDIDGDARPYNSVWDIGADEYNAVDVTSPNRSLGSPSASQPSNTTSAIISLETNENATCRYSTSASVAYGSMSDTFSVTGTTTHSTVVSGLSAGHIYYYYVRCADAGANANTDDYLISFRVSSAGTTYAESCLPADVNAGIAAATTGDIVSIPSGTCALTAPSSIVVNKAVILQGAGRGSTVYQIASTTTSSYGSALISISAAATVKSMTIETATTGNSGTVFAASANGFRISDIEYLSQTSTSNGYFLYFSAYGLVDNNDITGGEGSQELIFGRGPTNSWQTDSSIGKKDNLFIENNTFRNLGYLTDCNSNSRCVLRNNTTTGNMKADGHGKASNTPARGVRHMEIYDNTWTAANGSWTAMELRGGTGMVFSNTATGGGLLLHEYGATNSWPNFGSVIQTAADYPIDDQIGVGKDAKSAASEPMYLWNNIKGGSAWGISLGYGNQAELQDIIVANRDYYIQGASFDGTSGVGRGLLADRPATCTTGVGYWATDQGGNWNVSNGSSTDGMLYSCASANTWIDKYVPYPYPHVLTATGTIGTTLVDIGAGAKMFGNGRFYDVAAQTGTKADLSVTPGSDENSWVDISVSTWINSGTRQKVWTESVPHLLSTTTAHVVGDLLAGESYLVKVDGVLGQDISGAGCTAGVCVADGSGKISFSYSGGYSTHTFQVEAGSAPADSTAPALSLGSPSTALAAGTTAATLSVTTDESATCKYGTIAGTAYASISGIFGTTGGTTHTQSLSSLADGTSYSYFVRCIDGTGNANLSDYSISFSVASAVVSSGGSSGSSGGGGGGGGSYTIIYGNGSASTVAANDAGCAGSAIFSTLTGQRCAAASGSASAATAGSRASYAFARSLTVGARGADVRQLQIALNGSGFAVAKSGPGSAGRESEYFGPATRAALARYQAAKGIRPAAGFFGPATRASVSGSAPAQAAAPAASMAPASAGATLKLGSSGPAVKVLRQKLRAAGYLAPYGSASDVPASAAAETSSFGATTESALRKFQCERGIACSGSGWGIAGPATRAALGI